MAWYDTGTVSVTNGSTTVTGSGTNFVSGAQVGEGFYGPDGRLYEIQAIVSATSLTLADSYLGTTQSGQAYKIVPTQSLVANLASQVSTLISDFQTVADEAGEGKFADGSAASPGISFTQDQDTGFFRDTANEIGISIGGTKKAEFNSSGLQFEDNSKAIFGAGSDLQIYHDGAASYIVDNGTGNLRMQGVVVVADSPDSADGRILFGDATNAYGIVHYDYSAGDFLFENTWANAAADFVFRTNSVNALTISSTGVDVTGTVTADGLTVSNTGTGSTINVERTDGSAFSLSAGTYSILGTDDATNLYLKTNGAFRQLINSNGDISFYEDTGTTPKFFWDASAEALGIGTSSPNENLSIRNSTGPASLSLSGLAATEGAIFTFENTAATQFTANRNNHYINFITSSGGSVSAGGYARIQVGHETAGQNGTFISLSTAPNAGALAERLRITSTGNVGIGTISPAAKLEVVLGAEGEYMRVGGDNAANGRALRFTSSTAGASNGALHTINASSGEGVIALATGSTERMRITSTGNVGIGTSSPAKLLSIRQPADNNGIRINHASRATSTFWDVELSGVSNEGLAFKQNNGSTTVTSYVAGRDQHLFYTGGTERLRIDASGNLLVGKSSSSISTQGVDLRADGQNYFVRSGGTPMFINRLTSDGTIVDFRKDGTTVGSISVTGSATAYNTSSDYRLKEDVQPMVGASDRVLSLNPVNFAWKSDGSRVDGFLAHEAQAVVPEAVTGTKDEVDADGKPVYQGIDQSKLVPLLTAALQEALKRIEALEAQLNP